jgi:hypothetical protein
MGDDGMFNGIPWETSWGYDGKYMEISRNPPATALFFFGECKKKLQFPWI